MAALSDTSYLCLVQMCIRDSPLSSYPLSSDAAALTRIKRSMRSQRRSAAGWQRSRSCLLYTSAGTVGTTKFAGGSWNVQALLTGRTDQYNDLAADVPLVDGYYRWSDHGSDYCISEEEYLETKQHQQEIYQWFCNWLNGMDFENMSQMEKAQALSLIHIY